uniref:Ig-like domain-containing protein n=1 Tax=Poecilia reticulata TaxID=8081 RepID=A0A3P9N1N9_POERE
LQAEDILFINIIYIGEKVTLKCEIQDGRFRYGTKQWRKNNLNKPGWSQEYMITTATEFDSGDYSCRAGDRFFLSVWSDVFTLVVCKLVIFHNMKVMFILLLIAFV